MNAIGEFLGDLFDKTILLENEPMSRHCSFGIGGITPIYAKPRTEEEFSAIASTAWANGIPYKIIGNATNLLIKDGKLNFMVISTSSLCDISLVSEDELRVCCGCPMAKAATFAYKNSLAGMEFAHGIPGTVGGGIYMNAGAYGGEMKDIVREVHCADGFDRLRTITEHKFGYRTSVYKESDDLFILSAVLELQKGEPALIKERMDELMRRRKEKQPLEYPSAGSVFKRPEGHFAAALIEQCGLKGKRIGGAEVSQKHSGFIINKGGATFDDVVSLIEYVKDEVYRQTGITLECELEILR